MTNGLKYENNGLTAIVIGYDGSDGDVYIPSSIEGSIVVAIGLLVNLHLLVTI